MASCVGGFVGKKLLTNLEETRESVENLQVFAVKRRINGVKCEISVLLLGFFGEIVRCRRSGYRNFERFFPPSWARKSARFYRQMRCENRRIFSQKWAVFLAPIAVFGFQDIGHRISQTRTEKRWRFRRKNRPRKPTGNSGTETGQNTDVLSSNWCVCLGPSDGDVVVAQLHSGG